MITGYLREDTSPSKTMDDTILSNIDFETPKQEWFHRYAEKSKHGCTSKDISALGVLGGIQQTKGTEVMVWHGDGYWSVDQISKEGIIVAHNKREVVFLEVPLPPTKTQRRTICKISSRYTKTFRKSFLYLIRVSLFISQL